MDHAPFHTLADAYLKNTDGLSDEDLRKMPLKMKLARLPLNLLLVVFAQNEFRFDELPIETLVVIAARLSNSDLAHFCAVNRYMYGLCEDVAFINEVIQ